ncbi:MAG: hypothetical protein NC302_07195 [Bacteroidales bacterium]|nr:hypothetical protein [Bacteroidales bacterium]MCM1415521.1 hypothetical protein [bacterium]MCM1423721.1 hypothetical protein [bacterium]
MKNNKIKGIRCLVYFIALWAFVGVIYDVIAVQYVESMKIRNIFIQILQIAAFVLFIILIRNLKLAVPRVTILDVFSIAMLIIAMGVGLSRMNKMTEVSEIPGNNVYAYYYAEGSGDNGYIDIESFWKDKIKDGKQPENVVNLEEIYRLQVGERVFVYYREDEDKIVEYDFWMDDLYHYCGNKSLVYDGALNNDAHTTEETIRSDIANTMFRGFDRNATAPAWGVSTDEQISSMTINAKKIDDAIWINEKNGKKYYFWIATNVDEIETMDDVKTAEIKMSRLE